MGSATARPRHRTHRGPREGSWLPCVNQRSSPTWARDRLTVYLYSKTTWNPSLHCQTQRQAKESKDREPPSSEWPAPPVRFRKRRTFSSVLREAGEMRSSDLLLMRG